jgi:hypothetical protein
MKIFKNKLFLFCLCFLFLFGFSFIKYKITLEEQISKNNYNHFIDNKFDKIKNFNKNNFFENIINLKNKNINKEKLNGILEEAEATYIIDHAILLKAGILFKEKSYKEALIILRGVKGELLKPFFHLLRGDVLNKMKQKHLAYKEYIIAYDLFKDYEYKLIIIEKINNIQEIKESAS